MKLLASMFSLLISYFLVNAAINVNFLKINKFRACETYCPDPALPRAISLNEPDSVPGHVYPPLIHHIRNTCGLTTLLQLIIDETGLPKNYVSELISFGAVYLSVPHNGRKIKTPSTASTISVKSQTFRRPEIGDDALNQTELMTRASRVMKENASVPLGSYCRVHVNPRRHRAAIDGVDWKQRLA